MNGHGLVMAPGEGHRSMKGGMEMDLVEGVGSLTTTMSFGSCFLDRWLDVWAPGEGHQLIDEIMLELEYRWIDDVIVGWKRITEVIGVLMLMGIHVDKLLWLGGDGVWDGNMEGNVGFNGMNWVNYSCSLLFYGKRWDFINVFGLIGGN